MQRGTVNLAVFLHGLEARATEFRTVPMLHLRRWTTLKHHNRRAEGATPPRRAGRASGVVRPGGGKYPGDARSAGRRLSLARAARRREHRRPRRQFHSVLLVDRQQVVGHVGLANDDREDVLIEPPVVHRPEAFVPAVAAPTVFDEPFHRLAVADVDAEEDHRVVRHGAPHQQPVRLAVRQIHSVGRSEIEQPDLHDAVGAIHVVGDVGAEPDGLVGQNALESCLLQRLNRRVDVVELGRANDAADAPEPVMPSIVIGRVVAQRDVLAQIHAHALLVETLGRVSFRRADFVLFADEAIGELGRRLAVVEHQDAIDLGQHSLLRRAKLVERLFLGGQGPELRRIDAQYALQDRIHGGRVLRVMRLWHDRLGNQAVLLDQCDGEIPIAAVGAHAAEQGQKKVQLAVQRLSIGQRDHVLEERVGLFELVPERHVTLRELEILQFVLLDDYRPQDVERGKHPATAAGGLIRDLLGFDLVAEHVVVLLDDPAVEHHGLRIPAGQGVLQCAGRSVHFH